MPSFTRRAFHLIAVAFLGGAASLPDVVASDQLNEEPISEFDREHWSFAPLKRPKLPEVVDADWGRNPIDRFVRAKMDEFDVDPVPSANRRVLIRRLSFGLTGLPPTPEETLAFVNDRSPAAYERLVDRLLASPGYGERWGQHWLDLARYAETDGFEHDKHRPTAWKYRDWVIDAFKRDVAYDEFVRLQVAGDQLRPGDETAATATGFVLCGPDMPDINLKEERRHMLLNEATSTIGAVFLGLQFGCAQCHDHKYDPVSQADFYRLRAFFDGADVLKDQKEPRVLFEQDQRAPSRLMIRGDFRRPGPVLQPAFPRIVDTLTEEPGTSAEPSAPRTRLARWLSRPNHPLVTRVIVNRLWQHHFGEGLSSHPSDLGVMGQAPTHPDLLNWLATELPARDWSLKRMHRLIVTSQTYRLASSPRSADDVSRWTAVKKNDPLNTLLTRQRMIRLDGEALRDAMLAVSGRLNRKSGGPGVMTPLPEEVMKTIRKDHWKTHSDESEHYRRSVYLFVRRNLSLPMLDVFDRPSSLITCAKRNVTTIAPQALTMLNSQFSLRAARFLAGTVLHETGNTADAVDQLYRRVLNRPADETESQWAHTFLGDQCARLKKSTRDETDLAAPIPPSHDDPHVQAAFTDLSLALLNLNEFLYID